MRQKNAWQGVFRVLRTSVQDPTSTSNGGSVFQICVRSTAPAPSHATGFLELPCSRRHTHTQAHSSFLLVPPASLRVVCRTSASFYCEQHTSAEPSFGVTAFSTVPSTAAAVSTTAGLWRHTLAKLAQDSNRHERSERPPAVPLCKCEVLCVCAICI